MDKRELLEQIAKSISVVVSETKYEEEENFVHTMYELSNKLHNYAIVSKEELAKYLSPEVITSSAFNIPYETYKVGVYSKLKIDKSYGNIPEDIIRQYLIENFIDTLEHPEKMSSSQVSNADDYRDFVAMLEVLHEHGINDYNSARKFFEKKTPKRIK